MASFQIAEDEEIILVEFVPVPGVRSVSVNPKDAVEKSHATIEDALKKMRRMAKKTAKAFKEKVPFSRMHAGKLNQHLDQPRIVLVKWPLAVPYHRCFYASFR